MDKLLLSIPETCQATGLGETFIKKEIRTGRLLSVRAGDRRLIPAAAVRDYVGRLVAEAQDVQAPA